MNELIGVISDTHDNIPNVKRAVKLFNHYQVSLVIHCGDYVAPFILEPFQNLNCTLIGVLGNCDGEIDCLKAKAQQLNFSIYHSPYILTLNNTNILISHMPSPLEPSYDIQLYGHTHKPEIIIRKNNLKPSLIVNPGEASGWLFNQPTIALLYLKTIRAELIYL